MTNYVIVWPALTHTGKFQAKSGGKNQKTETVLNHRLRVQKVYICLWWFDLILQDFTLTIYLRQYWKDHRLSFKHILGEDIKVMPVDGRITDKLWLPDTYFTNDKDSYLQDITVKNRMVRIMKDGTVVFGLRSQHSFL